jgi:hypothetical protein
MNKERRLCKRSSSISQPIQSTTLSAKLPEAMVKTTICSSSIVKIWDKDPDTNINLI